MYGLRKAFPVHILLIAFTLLSIALFTGCGDKKEKASDKQNAPQAGTEEIRSQSISEKEETVIKASDQAKLPKLIELGADKCIPCKMMAPILEELKSEYAGRLEVVFIDVWKNPEKGREYGIRVIPTQILYDADGNEFYRHVGFFSKEDILKTYRKKGSNL
jgi:thioredoxin 1